MVPEIWNETEKMFCQFGLFLPFHTPENQNFEKMKKTLGECTKNHDQNITLFLRYDT